MVEKRIKESLRNPSSMKQREQDEFEAEAVDRVPASTSPRPRSKPISLRTSSPTGSKNRAFVCVDNRRWSKNSPNDWVGRCGPPTSCFGSRYINDQPVAWIDAKHFYGADVEFQRKKMKKQMNRYIEEWGSGAIMFRHGFSENLFLPGVLMLDASPLTFHDSIQMIDR